MSRAAQIATREALRAVNEAMRQGIDRQRFEITRFGRHRDGYLHAQVAVSDREPIYLHCRYGSWLVPPSGDQTTLREPEAVLGSELGHVLKYALSERAARFHPTPPTEEAPDA